LGAHNPNQHSGIRRNQSHLGNRQDAAKELEIASRIEPRSPEVHYNLARAYARTSAAQTDRERATFARLNAMLQQQQRIQGSPVDAEVRQRERPMPQVAAPTTAAPQ
jgi:hypothetical protein